MHHLTPYHNRRRLVRDFMRNFFDTDFHWDLPDLLAPDLTKQSIRSDIKETDTAYVIQAEIPGFTKDQIDISMHNGYLTIKARKQEEVNEEKEGYIRRERRSGEFQRSFKLHNVKEEDIRAKYENGILEITLPKLSQGRDTTKRIDIQ